MLLKQAVKNSGIDKEFGEKYVTAQRGLELVPRHISEKVGAHTARIEELTLKLNELQRINRKPENPASEKDVSKGDPMDSFKKREREAEALLAYLEAMGHSEPKDLKNWRTNPQALIGRAHKFLFDQSLKIAVAIGRESR